MAFGDKIVNPQSLITNKKGVNISYRDKKGLQISEMGESLFQKASKPTG